MLALDQSGACHEVLFRIDAKKVESGASLALAAPDGDRRLHSAMSPRQYGKSEVPAVHLLSLENLVPLFFVLC